MNKEHLIGAYEEWFADYHWNLFGTLTFRNAPSTSRADHLFRKWIAEMKKADGTDSFRWVRVTEHGAFGDNLHYHVLIGGLNDGCKWPWLLRWDELAGSADIFYYRPHAGGIRYMLKTARPDQDFEIDFDFAVKS